MLSTVTAIEPAEPAPARDPRRPARLLRAERAALLPILHRTPERAFDRPTACPGWSVRDVLAHCAAALSRVATGNLHAFTPAHNEVDVADRRGWPLADVLSELSAGYQEAGEAIAEAGGELDAIALGEWLHGGDVRAALGEPLAYASDGFDDACAIAMGNDARKFHCCAGDTRARFDVRRIHARVGDAYQNLARLRDWIGLVANDENIASRTFRGVVGGLHMYQPPGWSDEESLA